MARTDEDRYFDETQRQEIGYEKRALHELVEQKYHGGMERYIERGTAPGGFLSAFFRNNLFEAVARADDPSVIHNMCKYMYNFAASNCYGSNEKYEFWLKIGGYQGFKRWQRAQQLLGALRSDEHEDQTDFYDTLDLDKLLADQISKGLSSEDAADQVFKQIFLAWTKSVITQVRS